MIKVLDIGRMARLSERLCKRRRARIHGLSWRRLGKPTMYSLKRGINTVSNLGTNKSWTAATRLLVQQGLVPASWYRDLTHPRHLPGILQVSGSIAWVQPGPRRFILLRKLANAFGEQNSQRGYPPAPKNKATRDTITNRLDCEGYTFASRHRSLESSTCGRTSQ